MSRRDVNGLDAQLRNTQSSEPKNSQVLTLRCFLGGSFCESNTIFYAWASDNDSMKFRPN